MRTLFLPALMLAAFSTAWGENCVQLDRDQERLACFDAARRCVELTSADERLACFDSAYVDAHADAQSAPFEISATPEEFAGKDGEGRKKHTIRTTIERVTQNPYKIDYLYLENGQVWRESENTRFRFKPGREVVIEKGILGSFKLTMEGEKRAVKVKRVR